MSSGSPDPSVAPSSIVSPSVGTIESTPTRKKRTIVVVRRPRDRRPVDSGDDDDGGGGEPASPKKKIVVARRPRASEGRLFEGHEASHHHTGIADVAAGTVGKGRRGGREKYHDSGGHHLSSTVAGKLQWLPDGRVLEKSVLGTAAAFEEVS